MKYKRIREAWKYEITGNRQAGYSVEIKDKKSFIDKEQRGYFESFMIENFNDRARVSVENFQTFDTSRCSRILFFPKGKRIKEIDVIAFAPFNIGTDFLVSEKCWNILEKFNLPPCNKIPVEIDTFSSKYFLVGFGRVSNRKIDLSKSVFYDSSDDNYKKLIYATYEEFDVRNFSRETECLILLKHYDFDVISIGGQGVFFSDNLIEKIEEANIVGFLIYNTTLEC